MGDDLYQKQFHNLISNAKGEDVIEELISWNEDRTSVSLYLVHGDNEKRFVVGQSDIWHKNPQYTLNEAKYADAVRSMKKNQFVSADDAFKYYKSAAKPSWERRIVNSMSKVFE